jgi:hypothetical protein
VVISVLRVEFCIVVVLYRSVVNDSCSHELTVKARNTNNNDSVTNYRILIMVIFHLHEDEHNTYSIQYAHVVAKPRSRRERVD